MSQRELSRRSGVHQPNIAAIESGRTTPSPPTMERLLEAAKERPSVVLERHRARVRAIVAKHRGHEPRVFGSVARGTDTSSSDVDLLVRFDPGTSIFDVVGLARELEELLGTRVDIASEDAENLGLTQVDAVPV